MWGSKTGFALGVSRAPFAPMVWVRRLRETLFVVALALACVAAPAYAKTTLRGVSAETTLFGTPAETFFSTSADACEAGTVACGDQCLEVTDNPSSLTFGDTEVCGTMRIGRTNLTPACVEGDCPRFTLTVTPSILAGSLSAGTHTWVVYAVDSAGEIIAVSNEVEATVEEDSSVELSWPLLSAFANFRVYRDAGLVGTVLGLTTFTDDGSVAGGTGINPIANGICGTGRICDGDHCAVRPGRETCQPVEKVPTCEGQISCSYCQNLNCDPSIAYEYTFIQVEGVENQDLHFYFNPSDQLRHSETDNYLPFVASCGQSDGAGGWEDKGQFFLPNKFQHNEIDPGTGELTDTSTFFDAFDCFPFSAGRATSLISAQVRKNRGWWIRYVPNPLLVEERRTDTIDPITVGSTLSYQVTATNAGALKLENVVVSEPNLAGFSCAWPGTSGTLQPGQTVSCTGTRTVTQADVDAGQVVNQASATGRDTKSKTIQANQSGDDYTKMIFIVKESSKSNVLDPPYKLVEVIFDIEPADPRPDTVIVPLAQNPALTLSKTITGGDGYSAVGDIITYALVATNTGNVTLSGVTITDAQATLSDCTPALGSTLALGETMSCTGTYTVTEFDLTAGSHLNAAQSSGTGPDGNTVQATAFAEATAAVPAVDLTPELVNFGTALVGQSSAGQTVTLENTGTADLHLGTLGLSGDNTGDFALNDNCSGQVIAPDGGCTFAVAFTPLATGARSALVIVPSNAPIAPHAVLLSGTGVQPEVSLAPAGVDFGNVAVGETSAAQTITLENSGTSNLHLEALELSGENAGDFVLANDTCSNQVLSPGETCTVEVSFTPSGPERRSGRLIIASDAPTSPDIVELKASGVPPDHFLSYQIKISKNSPRFERRDVFLADQFLAGTFGVDRPVELLTPADENREGIRDPDTHLLSYKVHPPEELEDFALTGIQVENQLGVFLIRVEEPGHLLVPASKSLAEPLPPPDLAAINLDHFLCYPIGDDNGDGEEQGASGIEVSVQDQFNDSPKTFEIQSPRFLCNPVDKNGEGIKNAEDHLLCFQVKPAKGQPKHGRVRGILVADQFGELKVDTLKERQLCVPSTKRLP